VDCGQNVFTCKKRHENYFLENLLDANITLEIFQYAKSQSMATLKLVSDILMLKSRTDAAGSKAGDNIKEYDQA